MTKDKNITFKSYYWSVGTTTFRMAEFNRKIELQLKLLRNFREIHQENWIANNALQTEYYDFIKSRGFIDTGAEGARPDKDARQKTSGLVDIGLINADRRLTPAGLALLAIVDVLGYLY